MRSSAGRVASLLFQECKNEGSVEAELSVNDDKLANVFRLKTVTDCQQDEKALAALQRHQRLGTPIHLYKNTFEIALTPMLMNVDSIKRLAMAVDALADHEISGTFDIVNHAVMPLLKQSVIFEFLGQPNSKMRPIEIFRAMKAWKADFSAALLKEISPPIKRRVLRYGNSLTPTPASSFDTDRELSQLFEAGSGRSTTNTSPVSSECDTPVSFSIHLPRSESVPADSPVVRR